MGDADILIRREQYDQIKPVMEALGFEEGVWSNYDVHWTSRELLAELHYRLFSDNHEDLYSYFDDGWGKAMAAEGNRYMFSAEDMFLYIFGHMTKHFRFCGIGARQIVDLYVYRKANPGMDEEKIESVLGKIKLLEFYRNIKKLLAVWFEDAETDPVTELISDYVFSGGSFGTEENTLHAREIIDAQNTGGIRNAKFRAIWRALFPDLKLLQLSYNVLYRHPWLYPLFWIVRWVDILLNRRGNILKKGRIIINISDEGVDTHKKLLQDMGISYFS